MGPHRVEQVARADDVVVPVALGELDGLGDEREGGEVQDAVVAAGQRAVRRGRVEQVDLEQLGLPRDGAPVAAREAVQDRRPRAPARSSWRATTLPM